MLADRPSFLGIDREQADDFLPRDQRESDGRYAFVELEVVLDVELDPAPDEESVLELVSNAERDCFVGSSLLAEPRYAWTVNGESIP